MKILLLFLLISCSTQRQVIIVEQEGCRIYKVSESKYIIKHGKKTVDEEVKDEKLD